MSWQGKSRGGATGYSIFVFVLNLFGINAAYLLLRFVALYFVFFAPKSSLCSFQYFRNVLSYPILKSLISVYKNYYIFGVTLIDKVAAYAGVKTGFSFDFDGENYIRETVKDRGAILISAHIGNWEIASQLLNRLDRKVNIVMYDAEYQKLKDYLSELHDKRSFGVIAVSNNLDHIYKITQALNNNEIVCIHGDRFLPGTKTVKVPFFNNKANFPVGPFSLAAATGASTFFVFAMKEKGKHYHFYSTPAKTYSYEIGVDKNKQLEKWVTEYASNVEEMLKKYPLQWFNYYDFWKA